MKTGEKTFAQRFNFNHGKSRRWWYAGQFYNLEEIFPGIDAELAKLSEDRTKVMYVDAPLIAAAVSMFFEKVKADLKAGKISQGISDLTDAPFEYVKKGRRYALFVVDGKIVVLQGNLVDVNCQDSNDVVIGFVNKVVFWGPRKEAKKLSEIFAQFTKEAGLKKVKAEAIKLLTEKKQVVKNLPEFFKQFYGLSV